MKNETIQLENGRLVNGASYYEPIFINSGIYAIIYPPEVGEDNDYIIYYYQYNNKSLPICISTDMYIHYRPIFIDKKEIAILEKSNSFNGNDVLTYYKEYIKLPFSYEMTNFDPKNFYYAYVELNQKKRRHMKHNE